MTTGSLAARNLLEAIAGYNDDPIAKAAAGDRSVLIAVVDPAYAGGDPKVTFEGEGTLGTRTYKSLVPVSPSDRVIMLPVGGTYVITGVIGQAGRGAFAEAAGDGASGGALAASATRTEAIVFPVGRFTVAPEVTVQAGSSRLNTGVTALTTAGFTLTLANWTSVTVATANPFWWRAVQMTAAAAAG